MKAPKIATLCIYHGNCADGFGAAWVVRKALGSDVEFHAAHYGEPAPDVTDRNVIIVDFSYKYDALVALAEKAASVLVIDHHKTAMADLVDVPPAELHYEAHKKNNTGKLHALFDMNQSGASLTWDFFFPQHQRPDLINHIADRDLWKFKLPGTREIMADLFSYPQNFETWDLLFADDINALRLDGEAINRQHQKTVADLVRTTKRRMLIGGHDVPVANLPFMFASDAGHLMSEGELFAASYFDTPDGRTFSLRSTDSGMDVSEIAKQYGGGGHRNAAGFRVLFDHVLVNPEPKPDTEKALLQLDKLADQPLENTYVRAGEREHALRAKLHAAKQKLTVLEALLREALEYWDDGVGRCDSEWVLLRKLRTALSASAEPSAPVERDERAEIEEALLWLDDFVARCNGDDRGSCSAVETLRAALDKATEGESHEI